MKNTEALPFLLTHRPLTEAEARCLHEELKTTPNILGFTVRELLRARNMWVAEAPQDDGAPVFAGACLCYDLTFGWTEIAALYVLLAWRGQGIGTALLDAAFQRAQEQKQHVFMLSRVPSVIAWMKRQGMIITSNPLRAPLAVHLFMPIYMSSLHRNREGWRKRHLLRAAPTLVQGMKRFPRSS